MPSKPRKSSFTPAQIRIEDMDIVPLRVARRKGGGWSVVAKVTVAAGTSDGRRFGARVATVRIPVEQVGDNGKARPRSNGRARTRR